MNKQLQTGVGKPDLSTVKDAVAETVKAKSEEIKGLLERQWKAYAQLSTLALHKLDAIKPQEEQEAQQELQPQEHIHKHTFDIKLSKVFSFVVGLGVVCALSLWGNIEQWQSKRQYADDALKFHPSTQAGKEGTIYYQIIHKRVICQIKTDYRILADEWDEKNVAVIIVTDDRSCVLRSIKERINRDVKRLNTVVSRLHGSGNEFTANDIVEGFQESVKRTIVLSIHGEC